MRVIYTIDVRINVRALIAKNSVGRLFEVCTKSYLVRHGARRQEERCLFASELGHVCLESDGGWLMVNIVTEGGERCIRKHFLGRNWTSFEHK